MDSSDVCAEEMANVRVFLIAGFDDEALVFDLRNTDAFTAFTAFTAFAFAFDLDDNDDDEGEDEDKDEDEDDCVRRRALCARNFSYCHPLRGVTLT